MKKLLVLLMAIGLVGCGDDTEKVATPGTENMPIVETEVESEISVESEIPAEPELEVAIESLAEPAAEAENTESDWAEVGNQAWNNKDGRWIRRTDEKLTWNATGEIWDEVPDWTWNAEDGKPYKFDSEWKLLWSENSDENFVEVPSQTWPGNGGNWYKFDAEGKLFSKAS